MLTPQVPVAKEGYPFIGFAAFCTIILALLGLPVATLISFIATTFILCFFRDPERFDPARPDALVSPADGKVIHVEKISENPFTEGEAQKISIFMNVFNVHVNRIPCNGKVEKIVYKPGKFYSADSAQGRLGKRILCSSYLNSTWQDLGICADCRADCQKNCLLAGTRR